MVDEALTAADLARMVRQVMDSEDKEAFKDPNQHFAYSDSYRVPWRGAEIVYRVVIMRGLEPCPVCGILGGMGQLTLTGQGLGIEMRIEDLHILEVHAGKVNGKPVLDFEQLQMVLGMGDVPLVEIQDARLQQVLLALWEIQDSVIQQYYTYSRDMYKKRRQGYLTSWQDRTIRVWLADGDEGGPACPLCEFEGWNGTLAISLAEGETRVEIPAPARHLMEVHGLTGAPDWQVWNHPEDYEKIADFLDITN